MVDYVSIQLPQQLIDQVDEVIDCGRFGYTSRPELVKDAVRRLLLILKPKGVA